MKISPISTHLVLMKDGGISHLLVEYLRFWTSGICLGYHVKAQLFFSAKWRSKQTTDSLPLWSRILDVLPVALLVLFPVTLPVKLPALHLVALLVLLLDALLVPLPVALSVMFQILTSLKWMSLLNSLVLCFVAFCNFSLCETGCLEDRSLGLSQVYGILWAHLGYLSNIGMPWDIIGKCLM